MKLQRQHASHDPALITESDPAVIALKDPQRPWCRDVALVREVGVQAAMAMFNESDLGMATQRIAARCRAAGYPLHLFTWWAAAA
jgi:hypothetical protein